MSADLLDEVGRPGPACAIGDGGDVDVRGRLLSVAELQRALHTAYAGRTLTIEHRPATAGDRPAADPAAHSPATPSHHDRCAIDREVAEDWEPVQDAGHTAGGVSAGHLLRRRSSAQVRSVGTGTAQLPRGFGGAEAVEVSRRLADPGWPPLHAEICGTAGGVGTTTLTAAAAAFAAVVSVRPVLAVETRRSPARTLFRRVTGEVGGLPADTWRTATGYRDLDDALAEVPAAPSGLRCWDSVTDVDALRDHLGGRASLLISRGELRGRHSIGGQDPVRVLVARADGCGVDAALATAAASALDPQVLVLMNTARFPASEVRAASRLARSLAPVISVPWSPPLQSSPLPIDRLDKHTAAAIAALVYQLTEFTDTDDPKTGTDHDDDH